MALNKQLPSPSITFLFLPSFLASKDRDVHLVNSLHGLRAFFLTSRVSQSLPWSSLHSRVFISSFLYIQHSCVCTNLTIPVVSWNVKDSWGVVKTFFWAIEKNFVLKSFSDVPKDFSGVLKDYLGCWRFLEIWGIICDLEECEGCGRTFVRG